MEAPQPAHLQHLLRQADQPPANNIVLIVREKHAVLMGWGTEQDQGVGHLVKQHVALKSNSILPNDPKILIFMLSNSSTEYL